jgi:hypothetical protein
MLRLIGTAILCLVLAGCAHKQTEIAKISQNSRISIVSSQKVLIEDSIGCSHIMIIKDMETETEYLLYIGHHPFPSSMCKIR